MRLVPTLVLAVALASCAARQPADGDRTASFGAAAADQQGRPEPVRYLFHYDLEFLIAPAEPQGPPLIVGYGSLAVEMNAAGTDVATVRCRLFGFDQGAILPAANRLPRFNGEYNLDLVTTPGRWRTAFNPAALDNEMRFEFPALSADSLGTEGSWTFTTIAGAIASGPLSVRAFMIRCPGELQGPLGR